jgi:hypothetical protein
MALTAIIAAATAVATSLLPGVYADGDDRLNVVARANGGRDFAIFAIRDHDRNSGFITGTLPAGAATWSKARPFERCRLSFTVRGNAIVVAQDAAFGDCGFGYGVLADGIYRRIPGRPSLMSPRDR